ncbi:MAG: glutamate 5-kinase [Nitrospinae bacterium]|nr:glutamate 5-kinase [Nitrospinota bacterium]
MTADSASALAARREKLVGAARRIVVKVGSGVLSGGGHAEVNAQIMAEIARQVSAIASGGRHVALVSSGSVALGTRILGIPRHGLSIPVKQAAAALGQGSLISLWAQSFLKHEHKVGQVLLTHDDLRDRRRFLNARNTLNSLLDFGVIPVINENDTVSVDEIKFGDNDTLSARVTNLIEADLLVILSDVEGLYTADPRLDPSARKLDYVEEVDENILSMAGDSSSTTGLGGMASKARAAGEAARFGAPTIILPGMKQGVLLDAMEGPSTAGTFFFPHEDRLDSKRHWIEYTLVPAGKIQVDDGARDAIVNKGRSLLASGITAVEGEFEDGDAVSIAGPDGKVFAKGLINYPVHEVEKIMGRHSSLIETILGYKTYDEVAHRNDMVVYGE